MAISNIDQLQRRAEELRQQANTKTIEAKQAISEVATQREQAMASLRTASASGLSEAERNALRANADRLQQDANTAEKIAKDAQRQAQDGQNQAKEAEQALQAAKQSEQESKTNFQASSDEFSEATSHSEKKGEMEDTFNNPSKESQQKDDGISESLNNEHTSNEKEISISRPKTDLEIARDAAKNEGVELEKDLEIIYKGTTEKIANQIISSQGEDLRVSPGESLFFTKQRSTAEHFADRAATKYGGEPAVYAIVLPRDQYEKVLRQSNNSSNREIDDRAGMREERLSSYGVEKLKEQDLFIINVKQDNSQENLQDQEKSNQVQEDTNTQTQFELINTTNTESNKE